MAKKNVKSDQFAANAPKEHGGACPTCGHCKCCEKKAAPMIQYPPICTRPHYDWTYRPGIWYGLTAGVATETTTTSNAYLPTVNPS